MAKLSPMTIHVPDARLSSIRERVAVYSWHEMPADGGWDYEINLD